MSTPVILIADDEKAARHAMKKALEKQKYKLLEAKDGKEVLEVLKKEDVDLLFLDINMPEMDGFSVMEEIKKLPSPPLVVFITAYGDEKVAVKAMKMGAYDYIRKPPELDELRLITKNALETVRLSRENQELREKLSLQEGFRELLGQSDAMKEVFARIQKIAQTDVTVLIQGESGTGKELVAREIHCLSPRHKGPFIAVNCAALPEALIENELFGHEKGAYTGAQTTQKGKFELAHGGTLFLDEIGDMNLSTQSKVLRAIEEKKFQRLGGSEYIKVDVRVIAATNKDLKKMVQEGSFREDLYYRLHVMDIYLPPLRERKEDIPLLARHFTKLFAKKHGRNIKDISDKAIRLLMKQDWPGNVRQLKNLIEKAVILCEGDILDEKDLPLEKPKTSFVWSNFLDLHPHLSFREAKKMVIEQFEREFIERKLRECKGNISKAARDLDMHRQSLQHKLKELNIDPSRFKE